MDIWLSWATHRCAEWKPKAPIKEIFSSASSSTDKSVHIFSFLFFCQYYLGRRHAKMFHYAEKSRFLLARSCAEVNKHVLTGFSFPPHIIYLTLHCVF